MNTARFFFVGQEAKQCISLHAGACKQGARSCGAFWHLKEVGSNSCVSKPRWTIKKIRHAKECWVIFSRGFSTAQTYLLYVADRRGFDRTKPHEKSRRHMRWDKSSWGTTCWVQSFESHATFSGWNTRKIVHKGLVIWLYQYHPIPFLILLLFHRCVCI